MDIDSNKRGCIVRICEQRTQISNVTEGIFTQVFQQILFSYYFIAHSMSNFRFISSKTLFLS